VLCARNDEPKRTGNTVPADFRHSLLNFTPAPMTIRHIVTTMQLVIFASASNDGYSQTMDKSDEQQVEVTVNRFFESLEKQDTVLLKDVAYTDGQIWRMNYLGDTLRSSTRFFRDMLTTFRPDEMLEETALSFDIRIHKGLAMAWVPYEFRINGTFSHCGVDVFTLMKRDGEWKIATIAYTVESQRCDDLQK
jgi:hypothetical protein